MFGKSNSNRSAAFRKLCFTYQKKFFDVDDFGVKSFLRFFEIYRNNGKISNLCLSKDENLTKTFYIFDYRYWVMRNNHQKKYHQTLFFVKDREMFLPSFLLKPEHLGHKIAALFGWEDIDFETNEIFSSKYHLTGEDESWIRDNFSDKVLTWFSKKEGWYVEASNHFLLFYKLDHIVPESNLGNFYQMGKELYQLFKDNQKELLPVPE
jgi:hypothetical protein